MTDMLRLCPEDSPFDFRSRCTREAWATLTPVAVTALICLTRIRLPGRVSKVFAPLGEFLTVEEAEALKGDADSSEPVRHFVPLWRTLVLATLGTLEALAWLAAGSYYLITSFNTPTFGILLILGSLPWLYATARPIFFPKASVSYDLLYLYLAQLASSVLILGGILYDHAFGFPLPDRLTLVGLLLNMAAVVVLIIIMLITPVGLPPVNVKAEEIGNTISPEDYTSLFGWVTFTWVYPLIRKGKSKTLEEQEVWDLSPTLQSRPLFLKFATIRCKTLLRRIFIANALDLTLDFTLTLLNVVFHYGSPFFLRRILDAISAQTPEARSNAYIYATLMFICMILQAQADVYHLWYGRRASTRIKSELMAAIYDKALKRRDYSGIVDPEKLKAAEPANSKKGKKNAKEDEKKDDPKAGADVGKIVNLMAGDANKISQIVSGAYFLYGAPFEIIIAGTFLYQLLGISAFAGIVVLIVGWPLNSWVSRRAMRIYKGVATARDKRMSVLNELIGSVRFVKFFAWEEQWISRAMDARQVEMDWMVKARINSIMFYLVWTCFPILVSLSSFFMYVWLGNEVTVAVAFTAVALFGMIRAPLSVIPAWIIQLMNTKVALDRIATYLDEDEVSEQVSSIKRSSVNFTVPEETGLGIENGSFEWNTVPEVVADDSKKKKKKATDEPDLESASNSSSQASEHKFELRDISVRIPESKLTVVTGPTGSGKTALLMALLGEMTTTSGRIILNKDPSRVDENGMIHVISYAAQTPWLQHQSIRDNILFGFPYDEERYQQVLECCALNPDLEILEDGDATEIGARGVSLSGGQKARVALARAVYARTKWVLLDDVFSAVDSHTARTLFDRLFMGPLMANRTIVLVTHHVELVLPGAHYLIRMLDGRIDTQGTLSDLRSQGILEDIKHDAVVESQVVESTKVESEEEAVQEIESKPADGDPESKAKKPRKLVSDEKRAEGGVKFHIYKAYLKASSYITWAIILFFIVVAQLLGLGEKVWMKVWGEAYGTESSPGAHMTTFSSFVNQEYHILAEGHYTSGHISNQATQLSHVQAPVIPITLPDARDSPLFYVGVYGFIGLATALVGVLSSVTQYTGALRASRVLFKQLLVGVVRATMRWHDTTPTGRMLNRFGKDMETIDGSISGSLQMVNTSLASFFAALITVSVVFPQFIIFAVIVGYVYWILSIGYLSTGRDLRRMESNTRSPIYSGFGELLEGIVTVRAFSVENVFLNNLHGKIDTTIKMWYSFWMLNRWLLLNFDALGALSVYLVTLLALSGLVTAGTAGLVITSAMAFTTSIYWTCRAWTQVELDLNSVERVVEYLELPQEPAAVIESRRPPAYWPSSETKDDLIRVKDLSIRYSPELPSVLHHISFNLKAKERVGLLGRTGSGKSTLAQSILRFVEPESGEIIIDGIDISTIGLYDLRSRLTFIPQDSPLFSGTLRENLDPFGDYEDSECLDVLRRVQLIGESGYNTQRESRETSRAPSINEVDQAAPSSSSSITATDSKVVLSLETQVSAGGTNFSHGQRQLVAMARALLRRSSIIVLDEATSSIDFKTDAKIQATIREEFNDSLLLTVAHRLRTVIDYDRLIILDKGRIAEFDTPWNLINKEGGIFREMCLKSGTFAELEAIAKAAANSG